MEIVFATNNSNKLEEIRSKIPTSIRIKSLEEIGCFQEIPETGQTLRENAQQKSDFIQSNYKMNCFSDDTGLEIDALNGEPGVYSARYAGPQKNAEDNMNLVLEKLQGQQNRSARFKTIISLFLDGKQHFFEGVCEGEIRREKSGNEGFGYDPIFQPKGYEITFAEMSMEEKNRISHRGKAVDQLINFLNQL